MGVLQTTVAELVTVKEHQRKSNRLRKGWEIKTDDSRSSSIYNHAVRLVSRVRSRKRLLLTNNLTTNRSILGPMLGGALAQPCINYPSIFHSGTIFERFPYLLPNLVCFTLVVFGFIIGCLFLEETHAEKKHRTDAGLEAGKWIVSILRPRCAGAKLSSCEKMVDLAEAQPLINDDETLPRYQTAEVTPLLARSTSSTNLQDPTDSSFITTAQVQKLAVTRTFTRPVVLNIVGYGILA